MNYDSRKYSAFFRIEGKATTSTGPYYSSSLREAKKNICEICRDEKLPGRFKCWHVILTKDASVVAEGIVINKRRTEK